MQVKDEIERRLMIEKSSKSHNRDTPAYLRKQAVDKLSNPEKMDLIARDLQAIFNKHGVEASLVECLKVQSRMSNIVHCFFCIWSIILLKFY